MIVGNGAAGSVITRIKSEWSKLRDSVTLLTSRGLLLYAEDKLYSSYVQRIMLYRSNTWPVKEEDVVRLDRNNVSMVRWMCNVRPEKRVQGFPYRGDWGD